MSNVAPMPTTQSNTTIATEIRRLSTYVVAPRIRPGVKGSVNKIQLMEELAQAAESGAPRLSPRELVVRLGGAKSSPARLKTEAAIRKALRDIALIVDEWYSAHPDHPDPVTISPNGQVELRRFAVVSSAEREYAFRHLVAQIPLVSSTLVPWEAAPRYRRPPSPSSAPPPASVPARFYRLWQYFEPSRLLDALSFADLTLLDDILYHTTSNMLAGVVQCFSYQGQQIIAVEHHPTHEMSMWDAELGWLNDAYHTFIERGETGRKIVRLVRFDPDCIQERVGDPNWWHDWSDHAFARADTDHVRVIVGQPPREWESVLSKDLLVLPDRLVVRFEEDGFPRNFHSHLVHENSGKTLNKVAREIVDSSDTENVFELPFQSNRKTMQNALDTLKNRLLESACEATEGETNNC